MPFNDLREFIDVLEAEGELKRISAEVDPVLEVTEIADGFTQPVAVNLDSHGNLYVIDIVTGGNGVNFVLNNANLVIQGGSDAFAIFRVNEEQESNFEITQGNILVGDGGIGLKNYNLR